MSQIALKLRHHIILKVTFLHTCYALVLGSGKPDGAAAPPLSGSAVFSGRIRMTANQSFADLNSGCQVSKDLYRLGRYLPPRIRNRTQPKMILQVRHFFACCNLAYSALAWLMTGRSESASFQIVRTSW